ncbi:unnamed protein product, partial [Prorocentrum cordatum]
MEAQGGVLESLPPAPLFFAGALGGPACVFSLTPLRNAVSLGAADRGSGILQIYRRVFATGGWTGGAATIGPASVQCVALGPLFHFWSKLLGSNLAATMLVGVTETVVTYGSQTRNAQMAYNATVSPDMRVPRCAIVRPWGPGATFHVLRNVSGMLGLRVVAEPLERAQLRAHSSLGWGAPSSRLPADFAACLLSSAVSTAPALLHYHAATSREYGAASPRERAALAAEFLRRQYVRSLVAPGACVRSLVVVAGGGRAGQALPTWSHGRSELGGRRGPRAETSGSRVAPVGHLDSWQHRCERASGGQRHERSHDGASGVRTAVDSTPACALRRSKSSGP